MQRLMDTMAEMGFTKWPAIAHIRGELYTGRDIDYMLVEILEEIFKENPNVFPPDINSTKAISDYYSCFRSFERISNTRSIEMNFDLDDRNIANKWQKLEKTRGRLSGQIMSHHYAAFNLLVDQFRRYNKKCDKLKFDPCIYPSIVPVRLVPLCNCS